MLEVPGVGGTLGVLFISILFILPYFPCSLSICHLSIILLYIPLYTSLNSRHKKRPNLTLTCSGRRIATLGDIGSSSNPHAGHGHGAPGGFGGSGGAGGDEDDEEDGDPQEFFAGGGERR